MYEIEAIPPELPRGDLSDHGVVTDKLSIFFLISSNYPDNPTVSPYSSKPKFQFLQDKAKGVMSFWSYKTDYESTKNCKISGLNDLVFNGREELYQYMSQFKGYVVPAIIPIKPKKE